jgi:tRNA(Ile)-lysidine synthase
MSLCLDPSRLPGQGRILLAYSGGPDSVCLAALLAQARLARPVHCIHIDHGLDSDSAERARQAADFAEQLGLYCQVIAVRADDIEQGPEASARKARYRALAEHMNPDELLLTAHHADDQAETILMRLLRGAGPAGLAGIPAQRRFGPGWLARPLLDCSREQIMQWLQSQGLRWCMDPSNRDLSLDRNFLRHRILPQLRSRWPAIDGSIRRSGELCRGAAESLQTLEHDDFQRCRVSHDRLRLDSFAALSPYRRGEVLRLWCHQAGLPAPPGRQLDEFLEQLDFAQPDRQPQLRWDEHAMARHGHFIWLIARQAELPDESLSWDGSEPLTLPSGLGRLELLGSRRFSTTVMVRFGTTAGERIQLPGRPHHHAVKQLMSEAGVPPWQRALWPRLWLGERLVAIGQHWLSQDFHGHLVQAGSRLRWQAPFSIDALEGRIQP